MAQLTATTRAARLAAGHGHDHHTALPLADHRATINKPYYTLDTRTRFFLYLRRVYVPEMRNRIRQIHLGMDVKSSVPRSISRIALTISFSVCTSNLHASWIHRNPWVRRDSRARRTSRGHVSIRRPRFGESIGAFREAQSFARAPVKLRLCTPHASDFRASTHAGSFF